ncbi:hypothetical protein Ccrd_020977, partial [Cynara cardunculus var. scolymus]
AFNLSSLTPSTLALALASLTEITNKADSRIQIAIGLDSIGSHSYSYSHSLPLLSLDYRPPTADRLSASRSRSRILTLPRYSKRGRGK